MGYGMFIMAMKESAGWMTAGTMPTGDYCEFSHFRCMQASDTLLLFGAGTRYEIVFSNTRSLELAYGDFCKVLASGGRFIRFHSVEMVKETKE